MTIENSSVVRVKHYVDHFVCFCYFEIQWSLAMRRFSFRAVAVSQIFLVQFLHFYIVFCVKQRQREKNINVNVKHKADNFTDFAYCGLFLE